MKTLHFPRVTNDTKTSVLVFSADFFLKHFDIEQFTDIGRNNGFGLSYSVKGCQTHDLKNVAIEIVFNSLLSMLK